MPGETGTMGREEKAQAVFLGGHSQIHNPAEFGEISPLLFVQTQPEARRQQQVWMVQASIDTLGTHRIENGKTVNR